MSVIDDLSALQDHDEVIRDLEQQVKDIPIRKAQEEERLSSDLKALIEAREAVTQVKLTIREAESLIEERKANVQKLKQQQMTLKTNQEFAAMNTQIANEEAGIEAAELLLAERKDNLEPVETVERECAAKYDAAKAAIDEYVTMLDARLSDAKDRLEKALAERAEKLAPLAKGMGRAYLSYYERLRKSRWPVLVAMSGNVCTGCHMSQPPGKLQDIRRGTEVVKCDFCGRVVH